MLISQFARLVVFAFIINEDVFIISVIPLSSSANSSIAEIETKSEDLSGIINSPLQIVGWYHSHNELGLKLTEEDVEFHSSFQARFPNSIAFLTLFGKNSTDPKVKKTSFTAFRCGLNGQPIQVQCAVRPLRRNALADKFYSASCIAFDEILEVVREKLASLNPTEVHELDVGFLQPYLNSIELMIKSGEHLCLKSKTGY
nr:26S proteasome regulatory subunit N11 [Hymenolepis microstoma]